jgi:uncharacterized protein (DUF2147 family)
MADGAPCSKMLDLQAVCDVRYAIPCGLTEDPMRTALLVAGLLLAATPALAADPIEGEWIPQGGGSKVHISACPNNSAQMCGVVSWLPPEKAKDLDKRNPNAALRSRPILGVSTISGFKQAAPGKWTGGKLYDPASGKTYKGKLTANRDGTLKVEGCVLMICQTQTWKRG